MPIPSPVPGVPNCSSTPSSTIRPFSTHRPTLLPKPHYAPMHGIIRTVHCKEFLELNHSKQFEASKLNRRYLTLLPHSGKYVFFRSCMDKDTEKNDIYGNVGIRFDIVRFLRSDPTVHMFSVDCAYFTCSTASRILLTRKDTFEGCEKLELDNLAKGHPIIMKDGQILAADKFYRERKVKTAKRKRVRQCYRHSVEFAFDLETIDSVSIFKNSTLFVKNHLKANQLGDSITGFDRHQCLLYNSVGKCCPSAWSKDQTIQKLKKHGIEIQTDEKKNPTESVNLKAATEKGDVINKTWRKWQFDFMFQLLWHIDVCDYHIIIQTFRKIFII